MMRALTLQISNEGMGVPGQRGFAFFTCALRFQLSSLTQGVIPYTSLWASVTQL